MTTPRKPFALTVRPSNPRQVILVEEDELGFSPFGEPFERAVDAAAYADRINEKMGVSPAKRCAFTVRSMFAGSPATEATFPNAKPLLAEFQCSAATIGPR